ncbi:MAG: hypothetical protein GY875_00360 [Gammaproteobacteria bacterium]|nr:hypothetical protein [Gammaproteobacteria bacterium]
MKLFKSTRRVGGLIYAQCGNEGYDAGQYTTFPTDDAGIVPLTDTDWFEDDAANRLYDFISVAWDKDALEENLTTPQSLHQVE